MCCWFGFFFFTIDLAGKSRNVPERLTGGLYLVRSAETTPLSCLLDDTKEKEEDARPLIAYNDDYMYRLVLEVGTAFPYFHVRKAQGARGEGRFVALSVSTSIRKRELSP